MLNSLYLTKCNIKIYITNKIKKSLYQEKKEWKVPVLPNN